MHSDAHGLGKATAPPMHVKLPRTAKPQVQSMAGRGSVIVFVCRHCIGVKPESSGASGFCRRTTPIELCADLPTTWMQIGVYAEPINMLSCARLQGAIAASVLEGAIACLDAKNLNLICAPEIQSSCQHYLYVLLRPSATRPAGHQLIVATAWLSTGMQTFCGKQVKMTFYPHALRYGPQVRCLGCISSVHNQAPVAGFKKVLPS